MTDPPFEFNTSGDRQGFIDDLTIRAYVPGDEDRLLATFNLVFAELIGDGFTPRPMSEWTWLNHDNPVGIRIHIAEAKDGTIAGQWAGIPVRVKTPFGERVFVQIVDTLVHPDYRKGRHSGPGVFALLGAAGIKHWMTNFGDAALYGYPVPLAEKMGQRHLGYRRLRVVDFLCRPLSDTRPDTPSEIRVENASGLPDDLDAFADRITASRQCTLIRDRAYLRWRYVDCPTYSYRFLIAREHGELRGLAILGARNQLVPGAATIADWLVPSGDDATMDALLTAASEQAQQTGHDSLMAVFADPAPEHAALLARGFAVRPSAERLERRLTHWVGPAHREITDAVLAKHWWYTLGDSDLV